MRNALSILFHFLGGIYFAIFLIAITACMVVIGTFIESKTGSHLLAAEWTYANPFFFTFLFLFFINILFSALRRWPFKRMHMPFLLTHLGLLMIISGTILKNSIGLQGQMSVVEGSANNQVVLPYTYALAIEKKNQTEKNTISTIPLPSFSPTIYHPYHFPSLQCKIIGYATHVKEAYTTWIKNSRVSIVGFPSIPIIDWKPGEIFPKKILHHYSQDNQDWGLTAIQTDHIEEAIRENYLQDLCLKIQSKTSPNKQIILPFRSALENGVTIDDEKFSFHFAHSPSQIIIQWNKNNGPQYQYILPLDADSSLDIQTTSWRDPPFNIDLIRETPSLCLIQKNENIHFYALDAHGRIYTEESDATKKAIFSYDDGFQGYSVQAVVPFSQIERTSMEEIRATYLKKQICTALSTNSILIPPLRLLSEACTNQHTACADFFIEFLRTWNQNSNHIFDKKNAISPSLSSILTTLKWNDLSNEEWQNIAWTTKIFNDLEESLVQGKDLFEVLEEHHWPFVADLKQESNNIVLSALTKQILGIMDYLPLLPLPNSPSAIDSAQYLSAYFRIYGIDYRSLFMSPDIDLSFTSKENVLFETPLGHEITPSESPIKKEEYRPGIVLEIKEGVRKEKIALAYDSTLHGFKWPVMNGKYLLRLQPQQRQIPYQIRLRQARQILYPQSQQTYSYESDVWISEKGQQALEETLSMNHVYESWDGYRFYLSGVGNWLESEIRFIQLAVNYDPAKVWLTYPGAFFVFLGSLLLLFLNPYKKHSKLSVQSLLSK